MARTDNNVRYRADERRHHAIILAIILFLIGLIMVFVGTFAYYQNDSAGSVNGTIAAWSFKANNNATSFRINLEPSQNITATYTNSYNETVKTIAPGTSGSFSIELSTVNSALNVDYTITFSNFVNIPTNLKFCSDQNCNNVTDITATGYSLTGTLNAGLTTTKTVYWQWPANFSDSSSIAVDNASADKAVSFDITVVGQQKQ